MAPRSDRPRPRALPLLSRRALLSRATNGFGALAFASLLADRGLAADGPLTPRTTHFAPRAKRVIFLYLDGGPSQVDTFDPKPRLEKEHGQPIGMKIPKTQFDNVGTVLKSPWKFAQHGESGVWISELFPEIAKQAEELMVV